MGNKTQLSDIRAFLSALIDIAKNPQIFRHWLKERKAWANILSSIDRLNISDEIEIKIRKNGKDEYETIHIKKK